MKKWVIILILGLLGANAVSFYDLVNEEWTSFKILIILILGFLDANAAVSFYDLVNEEWAAFKLEYKKEYTNEMEEKFRMRIFMENVQLIARHNQLYEKGLVTYKLKINKWADLPHSDFVRTVNGYITQFRPMRSNFRFLPPMNVKLPDMVDWRKGGFVTPVKEQGQCRSCWAFSAVGAIEGQNFRKTKNLVELSGQNLMDCAWRRNSGCSGGSFIDAFAYLLQSQIYMPGGINTEESYPYEGIENECRYYRMNDGASINGFSLIKPDSEADLKMAVATVGPISVAINASAASFQFYSDGVYYEPNCNSDQLDRSVLVVGYGTEPDGQDYWLVKNSLGTSWGNQGYIKMARNKDNNCGIATQAAFPLIV